MQLFTRCRMFICPNEYHPFPYTFLSESNVNSTKVFWFYDQFSTIQHLLENKNYTTNHRNPKKTTTSVFNNVL